jgi:hypothetical protein
MRIRIQPFGCRDDRESLKLDAASLGLSIALPQTAAPMARKPLP